MMDISAFSRKLVLPLFLLCASPALLAQVPTVFSYQGRLLQNDAVQAPVDGNIDILFSIWSGPESDGGAAQLWSEQWNGVALNNGIFSVLLGSNGAPLDPADFLGDQTLFLQLQINGETLSPRQQLGSVPFAVVDDPSNEFQDLVLTGDSLQLTDSSSAIDLSGYLDNTDNQSLSRNGNTLELTSDDGVDSVDLSSLDNPPQDLGLDLPSNTLTLSDDPTPVDLGPYLDNTDNQSLTLSGNTLALTSDDGVDNVDLGFLDNAPQDLELNLLSNFLTLSDDPTPVDLSSYLDNSDNQTLTITGDSLRLSSDDGEDVIDLSPYLDNSDSQTLNLAGVNLSISGSGSTVGLGSFLDNTDNQVLSISGSQLRLTSDDGDDVVSLAGLNTDAQTLSLVGTNLSISGSGSTVSLASLLDNTDAQTLGLSGNVLTISGSGSSVNLGSFLDNTDSQNLNSVLAQGADANNRSITNVNALDVNSLTVENTFACDAGSANCIRTDHIEQDTIGGNDIQDNIYIVWIDCNGSCADMSMRNACDSAEVLRGLSTEAELIGVSCVHNVPSTAGNGFVECPVQNGTDNECRAFNLRTLGDIPCIDGTGTDAIVTCLATDIPL